MTPKLANGVTLQTFISNLRGVFGERTRDTTTKYEARYAGMGPEKELEQLLSIPTNPQMLIQGDSSNFFDCHQPDSAGVDVKYMDEEDAWMEKFIEEYDREHHRLPGARVKELIYAKIVPMRDF